MMSPQEGLQLLQRWLDEGELRSLDLAFARLLHELDGAAPASLLVAAALAAQVEGRGHSCVDLRSLHAEAGALLDGPAERRSERRSELMEALPPWPQPASAWRASRLIDIDPADADGRSPLVCSHGRLYLRRYWTYESRVAAQVLARAGAEDAIAADPASARLWLDRLFPPERAKKASARIDWQKTACALALRGRLMLITGGPGTGKTYTAARLLVLLQAMHRGPQPLRVALAAPTGKAAARLRQAIDGALQPLRQTLQAERFGHDPTASPGAARTLHALLGARPGTRRLRHDATQPLEVDLLFVDEASMLNLEMMAALLDALPPTARLVLLGDKDQLASVEAGAVMGDLCHGADAGRYTPDTLRWVQACSGQKLPADGIGQGGALARQTAMLRHSHRFGGPIGELAAAVNRGDAAAVLQQLPADSAHTVARLDGVLSAAALQSLVVHGRGGVAPGWRGCFELLTQRPVAASGFDAWAAEVLRAFDRFRVLCAVRAGPQGVLAINAAIEQSLVDAKLLARRGGEGYEGRPVMVTRNDAALGVFNGDIGLVLRPPGDAAAPLRVYFLDGTALRSVSSGRLADVETAFALTVHKSQGSEFEHVLLVLPGEDTPVLTRELVYTAITRARAAFTLSAPVPALVQGAVRRLTRRGSGLRALLDRGAGKA